MIQLPLLKEEDLIVYKGKEVLIYTQLGVIPRRLLDVFKQRKIKVVGYTSRNKLNTLKIMKNFLKTGVPYVPYSSMSEYKNQTNLIVQLCVSDLFLFKDAEKQLESLGFSSSPLVERQIAISFYGLSLIKKFKNPLYCRAYEVRSNIAFYLNSSEWYSYEKMKRNKPIIICSSPKTAEVALRNTFIKHNIDFFKLPHRSLFVNKKVCEDNFEILKVMVGLREPISQNLSLLFENISGEFFFNLMHTNVIRQHNKAFIGQFEQFLLNYRGNVQMLWDMFLNAQEIDHSKTKSVATASYFFTEFNEKILNLFQYPFDQEKGYTIIKEGNTEVFIYQLEKLNNIV